MEKENSKRKNNIEMFIFIAAIYVDSDLSSSRDKSNSGY